MENISIAGSGKISGGEYAAVTISGSGRVTGNLRCTEMRCCRLGAIPRGTWRARAS